jgi:hypothetical protein
MSLLTRSKRGIYHDVGCVFFLFMFSSFAPLSLETLKGRALLFLCAAPMHGGVCVDISPVGASIPFFVISGFNFLSFS